MDADADATNDDPVAALFASALASFVASRAADGIIPAPRRVSSAAAARAAAGGAAMGWGVGSAGIGDASPAPARPSFLGAGHHGYAAAREAVSNGRASDRVTAVGAGLAGVSGRCGRAEAKRGGGGPSHQAQAAASLGAAAAAGAPLPPLPPTPPPWLYATGELGAEQAPSAGTSGEGGVDTTTDPGAWWATPAFAAAAAALAGRGGGGDGGDGGRPEGAATPLADLLAGWRRLGGGG